VGTGTTPPQNIPRLALNNSREVIPLLTRFPIDL
jgi:hypothetical protein